MPESFNDMDVERTASAIVESFDGEGPETDEAHFKILEGIIRGEVDPDQAVADAIRKHTNG